MTLVLLEAFIYVSVNDEVRFNETIRKKKVVTELLFFFFSPNSNEIIQTKKTKIICKSGK